jgi:glycosyltransferase involved in cell wall biosynthesis
MTGQKILIASSDIPGYGAGGTSGYRLFLKMRAGGLDVAYFNLIEEQDVDFFRFVFGEGFGNPDALEQVYNVILKEPLSDGGNGVDPHSNGFAPTVAVAIGFEAAVWLKKAAPGRPVFFIPVVCREILESSPRKRAFFPRRPPLGQNRPAVVSRLEREAAEIADLIIAPSPVVKASFEVCYPSLAGKIYEHVIWDADWRCEAARAYFALNGNFQDRDIAVLFVATSWEKPEKNYPLVERIASRLKGLNVHVVGEVPEKIPEASHHGIVTDPAEYYGLMGRAKTVVCASLFDPVPEALFEAAVMGCNIVAPRNCGYRAICNEDLLVDNFRLEDFMAKVSLSLTKPFASRLEQVTGRSSYPRLLDLLSSFAGQWAT